MEQRVRGGRRWVMSVWVLLCLIVATDSLVAIPRHPGPSIWGDMVMHQDHMVFTIEGAADPLTSNLGLDTLLLGPLEDSDRQRLQDAVESFFRQNIPILFDGERSLPSVTQMIIQDGTPDEASWKSARVVLSYPYQDWPRQMSITWHAFEGEGVDYIPIIIRSAPDASPRPFSLDADEPQYIWHAEDLRRSQAAVPVAIVKGSRRKGLPLPLPSALLALLALIFLLLRRRLGSPLPVTIGVSVVSLVLAGLLWGKGKVEVQLSFSSTVQLPAPAQAKEIFESLHRNIYEAFRAETEDGIYDLLATSVDRAILDDLYGDVYESLILREQGGAVCNIDRIETLDGEVDPAAYVDSNVPQFTVKCHWKVHGVVSHWGHIHRRINEYRAVYTVRHDGESWKIADVKELDHSRVLMDE